MCSQTPAASHASAIAGTGSTDPVLVVPIVATTAHASSRSSSPRAAELVVGGNGAELELEQARRLGDGRVRVLGADDDPPVRPARAGRCERAMVAVDAVSSMCPCSPSGSPSSSREPVERHLLELLQGGRGSPEDPHLVQRRDQELGEDRPAPSRS